MELLFKDLRYAARALLLVWGEIATEIVAGRPFDERDDETARPVAIVNAGPHVLALVLAGVGVYGLMSVCVSQRRRQVDIRMALGATRGNVFVLFLKEAAVVVVLGLAIGLPAACASGRLLSSLLFGVSPENPWVVFAVVSLLAAVAMVGSLLPSVRATRLDPISTLRHD